MNRLLRIGFKKAGYDYEFLTRIHKNFYDGKYLFADEDRILVALQKLHASGARAVIMQDFDIDGISAGCVLYSGLSLLGFNVSILPPRTKDGYGIRFDDIDRLVATWPDAKAVITCDVGCASRDEAVYAQSKELWFYVTDHHIEKPGHRTADAMMDPSAYDSDVPFKGVCGAWVAWHLVSTYAKLAAGPETQALIDKLLLFVGLGSCGDMMPMIHDTRSAVKASIAEFNKLLDCDDVGEYLGVDPDSLPQAYVAPFENLRALHFDLMHKKMVKEGDVTDETYSFSYCPLFNSVKRMGGDMRQVHALLFQRYDWGDTRRTELFDWLTGLNDKRKATTALLYGQLYGDPRQALAPYVYLVDADPGILGLLANKIMEQTGRPCLVLRPEPEKDGYAGSGRTPGWFSAGGLFETDGVHTDGHEHSFGAFVREDRLMDFWKAADARYASEAARYAKESSGPDPRPVVVMNGRSAYGSDYDFSINGVDDYDVCMEYAHEIQKYRPFGDCFREPEFIIRFTPKDVVTSRAMGSDNSHLRVVLDHNITCVWFGGAAFLKKLGAAHGDDTSSVFGFSGTFSVNRWNGAESLQFMVSGEA